MKFDQWKDLLNQKQFIKKDFNLFHLSYYHKNYNKTSVGSKGGEHTFSSFRPEDIEDMQKEFQLDRDQLEYHLSMLKQGLYVITSDTKWKATPRGLGFLANAIMG